MGMQRMLLVTKPSSSSRISWFIHVDTSPIFRIWKHDHCVSWHGGYFTTLRQWQKLVSVEWEDRMIVNWLGEEVMVEHFSVLFRYNDRDQTMNLTYVTNMRVEEKIICYVNQKHYLRQRATKYCCWEIRFIVWTGNASLSAVPPTPDPLATYF
jgi:hypothetical protein